MHHMLALLLAVGAAALIASGAVGPLAEETEAAAPAPAAQAPSREENCLSPADMREAVAEKRVIAPVAAIRAARKTVSADEIQRASLCKHPEGLVYVLTALRRNGTFVQITVDAQSGQVQGQ